MAKTIKKTQTVLRTRDKDREYSYEFDAFRRLHEKLEEGFVVVMAIQIGHEIEYILEKEVEENEDFGRI